MSKRCQTDLLAAIIVIMMLIIFISVNAAMVYAEDTKVTLDEIKYTLDIENGTATVTGRTENLPSNVVIPATVNGYNVTSIGLDAFKGSTLASVSIPASLTSIGESAFHDCSNLTTITIPAGVTDIGRDAFRNAGLTTICFETESQLEAIGKYAFDNCDELTAITIPAGVTSIGINAFDDCENLGAVIFENGSRLETISEYTFKKCTSLTAINIPTSVTSIGYEAFFESGLTECTIPASVTTIESRVFQNCSSLSAIHYAGTEEEWDGVSKDSTWAPDSLAVHFNQDLRYAVRKASFEKDGAEEYQCKDCDYAYSTVAVHKRAAAELSAASFTYDGKEKEPTVTVKDADGNAITASNYDVKYSNNINAGTATATVSFKDNCDFYEGSKPLNFTIKKATNSLSVTSSDITKTYGSAAFSLGAKTYGEGALSYKSSNTKVVTVSNTGKVTIKGAGTAKITINAVATVNYEAASKTINVTINKASNPLKVKAKAKAATVKYSKLKKKTQTLAFTKVISFTKKTGDKKNYTLSSAKKGKKNFKKYFKINKTTGKVTLKKGLKKGTYKVTVKIKAKGNANYNASKVKTVTFKVIVK